MAIYHCSVKTIGRSGGSSAVNSAAYRSGEKLFDESIEKTFFYSGKSQDVMHKEIMVPSNVKVPDWVYSREKLWNAVELSEKRKDSQLAREIEISLPREFTIDQNIALVREYVNGEFVDKGMIADVCLHYGMKGDNYNPHAHVMLTMREIGPEGFGKKEVSWNKRALLNQWRESWAEVSNKHLSLNGYEMSIDHRSLKAQGIDLIPQNVELPIDAKDRLTGQRDRQLEIMHENGERLSADPGIVLSAITKYKSVFSDSDISHYLKSRTADHNQFQNVYAKVKAHEDLVQLSVKDGKCLYTIKEIINLKRNHSGF
jgi:ATP-dependent exoDNAse (exonuclease V) alpha subunit